MPIQTKYCISYGYCPVKLHERALIHPNGIIRICSGLLASSFGIARWSDDFVIRWDETNTNETKDHKPDECTPCTNQTKGMQGLGDYVPLCFSLKPNQDEIVWHQMLQWEKQIRKKGK